MKKRIIITAGLSVLAAGLLALGLAGCSGYHFEKYEFNNGGTERDWRALEYPDQNITMDGVVEAAEYGEGHLSFSDVNNVNMKVYAHMGEEGVFFGFVSDDRYVNYNPDNDVFNNTSVEIQVAPFGTSSLNANVVQLRLSANATPDQWIGFKSDDGYAYSRKYIPSMGVVQVNGTLNELCEGYSVELYLPYTSIGLDEKPESVVCAPSFNTMPNPLSTLRATWTIMLGCQLQEPSTWYVVDESGMTPHTAGFVEKNGGILQQKNANEFYFFDSDYHTSYYLKSELIVDPATSFPYDDGFPKFGLVNKSNHELQAFYIDAAGKTGFSFGTVKAKQSTQNQTAWGWDDNESLSLGEHWGDNYIKTNAYRNKKLETIYYDGVLYFVLDGTLVKSVKNFSTDADGAVPGFMCFNTNATFTNNEFVTDPALVKAELDTYLAKERTIDGNLSDWTDEAVNKHSLQTEDLNGNSMKVRAFRGEDGLYIAYNVHHIVNLVAKKWGNGWWYNTNIEFRVNGSDYKGQYALTSFGDGGYLDGVMITERREDKTYDTVAEIFVPYASLERDGFPQSGEFRIGFAFKSVNGTADDKLNGRDWWTFGGDPDREQFLIGEKGIGAEYTLSYAAGEDGVTGEAPAEAKYFAGDTVVLAENTFSKSGYTFVGWTDGTSNYKAGDVYTMPAKNTELMPVWKSNSATAQYTVSYEKGNTSAEGNLPTDGGTYATGDFVTVLGCDLELENYRFAGWSYGGKVYEEGASVIVGEENITFTAVWKQLHTLKYEWGTEDEVEGDLPSEDRFVEGDRVLLAYVDCERAGYDLVGWSYNGETYAFGASFEMPDGDVTFTAVWQSAIWLDGDLSDWETYGTKTIGSRAIIEGDARGATWYGMIRSDGLYLAVELWHNSEPVTGDRDAWFNNLNFEIRLKDSSDPNHFHADLESGSAGVYKVRLGADGGTDVSTSGVGYKLEDGEVHGTTYHSVFEIFLANTVLTNVREKNGDIKVGLAVKTGDYGSAERITGGSVNYDSGDTWYSPYGMWPDNVDYFGYVTEDGLYLKDEYEHPDWKFGVESAADDDDSITIDGDISDWGTPKTIKLVGTQNFNGKSVEFYGKLTKKGLYLAADAHHSIFASNNNDPDSWHQNTNIELRIGRNMGGDGNRMPKQYWVRASGDNTCVANESYVEAAIKHVSETSGNATDHTVIELFIPIGKLVFNDYMIADGMMYVGMAWKTPNDNINNIKGNEEGDWWRPAGTDINWTPACVTGDGFYTKSEFDAKV